VVISKRHSERLLGAVFTALVVCLGALAAPAPSLAAKHGRKLSKRERIIEGRKLQREIRGNPQAILKSGFLKKAQAVDLSLPLTLRLNRPGLPPGDDSLAVVWDSSTWAWPEGYTQLQPASPTDPLPGGAVPLDGRASVEAEFGNDVSGYGSLGVVETTNGRWLQFVSGDLTSPIPVTGLPTCRSQAAPLPSDPTDSTMPAVRLTRMDLVAGEGTSGLLNLFGGTARVSLHVRLATTTEALDSNCSGTFGELGQGNYEQGSPPPSGDPIVPISFDARFRISPAVDSDGKIRLGILSLPAGVTQPTTFARISTCIQQESPGCTVVRFPARLAISQLNAEILVGDQPA
jgi:hypothetical protein